jgi:nucleotide-binding universal stress UspA family protein
VTMRSTDTAPVVVGVNGTAAGLAAVRMAARESVARGQPLRVVHAFAWPGYGPAAGGVPYDELRHAAAEVLARAVTTATRSAPAARVSGYLVDGPAARVLLQQSRTAGLLVLGDDDPGATVRLPTDSVLVQAVARSRCPVLVARGVGRGDGPVVVGVDGSPAARVALRYAAAEAVRRHASLHVLHVYEPKEADRDAAADPAAEAAARPVLDAALADAGLADGEPVDPRFTGPAFTAPGITGRGFTGPGFTEPGHGPPPIVRAELVTGDPAAVLVQASGRARLLVVGPSGTEGRFGALLGAAAQTVLRRSGCPTVFVHGPVPDIAPAAPPVAP